MQLKFKQKGEKKMKKLLITVVAAIFCLTALGCGGGAKTDNKKPAENKDAGSKKVVIFSSAEEYKNEFYKQKLKEKFPQYDIVIEYLSTGKHAAKLKAEGEKTLCDITVDLEQGYAEQLKPMFADLGSYDTSRYMEDLLAKDKKYLPECRVGGAIILNTEVLKAKGLKAPQSYEDLLKPEYKGLISMPSPKASGTGYIFLKALVNSMGEDKAFAYFDKLSNNILQYTSSGSGPVNALINKEVAIGLGMTAQGALKKTEGAPFEIIFFKEGSPYTFYTVAMIKGKEKNKAVKEVFDYLSGPVIEGQVQKYYPEKLYKDKDYTIKNMPEKIKYADMKNNTIEEKERLLAKWNH